MDSFVVYHTWRFIGAADFALAHMESGSRIVPIFVLPMLAMTVFLIIMFWHRPYVISRKCYGSALFVPLFPGCRLRSSKSQYRSSWTMEKMKCC